MKSKHHSKHQNQVRIISGTHRGRKITFQQVEGLRPTPDRVREQIFNWLGQDLTGKSVLDLFAGSGALGFEAASRRANKVCLVEKNRQTATMLQQYAHEWNMSQVTVYCSEGLSLLNTHADKFDVVFLDPPFKWNQWPQLFELLINRLKDEALVYLEAKEIPVIPNTLEIWRQGKAGMSHFVLLKYKAQTME